MRFDKRIKGKERGKLLFIYFFKKKKEKKEQDWDIFLEKWIVPGKG